MKKRLYMPQGEVMAALTCGSGITTTFRDFCQCFGLRSKLAVCAEPNLFQHQGARKKCMLLVFVCVHRHRNTMRLIIVT